MSTGPIDLLILAEIAELGDFSGAADRLGLSKSSVSRRLAAPGRAPVVADDPTPGLAEFGSLLLEHARRVAAACECPCLAIPPVHPSPADGLSGFAAEHPGISLELG